MGHSYYSYMLGIELQKRGVIRFYILIDRPVNFDLIHRFWNNCAGCANPQLIRNYENSVYYVTKYSAKYGEIDPHISQKKLISSAIYTKLVERAGYRCY